MESASELPSSLVAFDEVYKARASSALPPRPPPRPSTAVKSHLPGARPATRSCIFPSPGIAVLGNYEQGKPSRPPRTRGAPLRAPPPHGARQGPGHVEAPYPLAPTRPRVPQSPSPAAPTLAGRRRTRGGGRARPAHLKVKPSARSAEPSAALDRPRQLRRGAGDARGRAGPATRPAPSPRRPRAPWTRPPGRGPGASRDPGAAPHEEGAGLSRRSAGPRLPPAREWSAL